MNHAPGGALHRAGQRRELLRWLANSRVPHGFGWLDDHGGAHAAEPIELWITCRMTHVAALGAMADEPSHEGSPDADELRALAVHGVASLHGPLQDGEFGGWYASAGAHGPTNSAKQAYGHAFVVLAASTGVAAGIARADVLLQQALDISLSKFWDEGEGMCVDEWDGSWTILEPYRGVNANMHMVEAYLAAGDVTGDDQWHARATRIAMRVAQWACANDWRVPEHFDEAWRPLLDHHHDRPAHPFQPFGATVGHGFEWSRLLLAVAPLCDGEAATVLRHAAISLYDRAVEDGWHADDAPGFVYTTDWHGRPVVRSRMHWVLAEALNAAASLECVTGSERFRDAQAMWWEYADRFVIDHRRGSWHHELTAGNVPAAETWVGRPDVYHAYQAALLPDLPFAASFASAVSQLRSGTLASLADDRV